MIVILPALLVKQWENGYADLVLKFGGLKIEYLFLIYASPFVITSWIGYFILNAGLYSFFPTFLLIISSIPVSKKLYNFTENHTTKNKRSD